MSIQFFFQLIRCLSRIRMAPLRIGKSSLSHFQQLLGFRQTAVALTDSGFDQVQPVFQASFFLVQPGEGISPAKQLVFCCCGFFLDSVQTVIGPEQGLMGFAEDPVQLFLTGFACAAADDGAVGVRAAGAGAGGALEGSAANADAAAGGAAGGAVVGAASGEALGAENEVRPC